MFQQTKNAKMYFAKLRYIVGALKAAKRAKVWANRSKRRNRQFLDQFSIWNTVTL